jgi:hypothetical protein
VIALHAGEIARAVGRARLQLTMSVIPILVLPPLLIFAARSWGLVGLTTIYSFGFVLNAMFRMVLVRRVVRLPVIEALQALRPGAVAALLVLGPIAAFLLASEPWPDFMRLIGAVAIGAIAYVVALFFLGRELLQQLIAQVQSWRLRGGPRLGSVLVEGKIGS